MPPRLRISARFAPWILGPALQFFFSNLSQKKMGKKLLKKYYSAKKMKPKFVSIVLFGGRPDVFLWPAMEDDVPMKKCLSITAKFDV
jgi:hypothetical protein